MFDHLVLTGATGYLGNALLHELQRLSLFCRITATFHNQRVHTAAENVEFVSFSDLLDGGIDLGSVDIICHLGVPRVNPNDPLLARSLIELRKLLLKGIIAGVGGFVYASSQAVYGTTEPVWFENSPLAPVTNYGWSKLAGEQLIETTNALSSSLRGISLRLPKLIGPGRGFRIDQGEWVHKLAYAALQRRKIAIGQQFLSQQFDFMDVRDAALAIASILAHPPETWPTVLNVGLGQFISGQKLIATVDEYCTRQYQRPLRYVLEKSPGHARNFGMDVTSLSSYLGGVAGRSLLETISDVCQLIDPFNKNDLCS